MKEQFRKLVDVHVTQLVKLQKPFSFVKEKLTKCQNY